jgi:dihydroorotate dehydrogenase (NAD+) catalytic subunit
VNLAVQLASNNQRGLVLKNSVMTASGTFGYGTEYADFVDIQRLGAIVCKGTTLEPREGNPQPRLAETPSGLLNSIGLQNIGVEALVKEKAPIWTTWRVPVIVNIAGDSIDDYARLATRLEGVAGVSGLEVNIGCPNVKSGGMEFGTDPKAAASVTKAVKRASSLPVIVKLTPNVTSILEIAEAAADAGADALCLVNTLRGMAIDVSARKPSLGNICGGLSGPAIKPVALYMVYQVAGRVNLPIVGCGGIMSAQDALEFIMAGASAVEVGTAQFVNPRALLDVLEAIEEFMLREGVKDISELVGAAR